MNRGQIGRWQRSKLRIRQRRPQRRRILIVCEGKETERNYFDQAKRVGFARDNLAVTVKRGKGGSREQIAQFAAACKNGTNAKFDDAWCVMDAEQPTEKNPCEGAVRILIENGIKPCLSNPAFEVWLLSHFQKTTKAYLDCDAVQRDLNPHWKSHFDRDYDKAEQNIFGLVSSLTATAVGNAQWAREEYHSSRPILDCNPATDIYKLVKHLLGQVN